MVTTNEAARRAGEGQALEREPPVRLEAEVVRADPRRHADQNVVGGPRAWAQASKSENDRVYFIEIGNDQSISNTITNLLLTDKYSHLNVVPPPPAFHSPALCPRIPCRPFLSPRDKSGIRPSGF